jgi:hypothetical protein
MEYLAQYDIFKNIDDIDDGWTKEAADEIEQQVFDAYESEAGGN